MIACGFKRICVYVLYKCLYVSDNGLAGYEYVGFEIEYGLFWMLYVL